MCGIVGYVGNKEATPILLSGLRRLEYRGYDSAGVAVANGAAAEVVRSCGKLARLEEMLQARMPHGNMGIGHTRWATHGGPSDRNAHPHKVGGTSVVHNGIIENHVELRRRLKERGRHFASETDTEIVAHLVDEARRDGAMNLLEAVRRALAQLRGSYALCVLSDDDKDRIVAARQASPLVIGVGDGETFVASDVPAFLRYTRNVIFMDDGDIAEVTRSGARITALDGQLRERAPQIVAGTAADAEKGGYPHFMLKEIHEQPRAVEDTLRGRLQVEEGDASLDGFHIDPTVTERVLLLACGTSYHAGMVGKYLIESTSRIPCEVDLASEFRYRDPVVGPSDLVIAISQSGETADTLAAVAEAKAHGARVLAITNVAGSAIARAADGALLTRAGLEIGVASTKAFTSQLAALALVAIHMGHQVKTSGDGEPKKRELKRGTIAATGPSDGGAIGARARSLAVALAQIPVAMAAALEECRGIEPLARELCTSRDVLYMGRGINHPIALEGALKLKEISYIHAEGYAAGEMKHGPIALVEEGLPVVVLAPQGPGQEKVLSNLAEMQARRAHVIAVATIGDDTAAWQVRHILRIPAAPPLLQPFLTVLPLQMLSYAVALARGNDVDQPRNLAKSVTVE